MGGITLVNPGSEIIREFYIGETMYEGQLAMSGDTAGTGANLQILDVAAEADEDAKVPIALVLGAVNQRTDYNATYQGSVSTYTVTSATMAADEHRKDAAIVQAAIIRPYHTILRAPIYDGAYGTAIVDAVEDSGSSYTVYQDATYTLGADVADDFGTMYIRSGANRGLDRICTTFSNSTLNCTTTLKFPYANAVGDKFTMCGLVEGYAHGYFGATANYIDADQALTNFISIYVTKLNLEVSGQEYAEFMIWQHRHTHASDLRLKTDVEYL